MKIEFSNNTQLSSVIKIRPMVTELFYEDRQSNGQTDGQTKGIVAFRGFVKALKITAAMNQIPSFILLH
jgi:hypothetical protein